MKTQVSDGADPRRFAVKVAPFVILTCAGLAVRTPLAAAYPRMALLVFLWIVSDTLMLALIARASRRPAWPAIVATLAGACIAVGLGSPPVIRNALWHVPLLAAAMALVVSGHVVWATARAGRMFGRTRTDAADRWVAAASEILPPPFVRLVAAELAIVRIALFRWGGPADVPANARGFAYHAHLTPMCATLLILSAIEIAVYHLLVGHWSRTAALVMFVLSDVGFVYLLGLVKSFRFRPVLLTSEGVRVRAGFLIDQFVPLDAIVAVERGFAGEEVRDPATWNAALLAWPNILLRLDRPLPRRSFPARRGSFDRIAFRLDDPEPFIRLLRWRLGQPMR